MFFSDNDKPSLSASRNTPVENGANVVLSCGEAVSSIETASSYTWYKDGSSTAISGQTTSTYDIGNKRDAAGFYTCKVVALNSGTSVVSDSEKIEFYCEYFSNTQKYIEHIFFKRSTYLFETG